MKLDQIQKAIEAGETVLGFLYAPVAVPNMYCVVQHGVRSASTAQFDIVAPRWSYTTERGDGRAWGVVKRGMDNTERLQEMKAMERCRDVYCSSAPSPVPASPRLVVTNPKQEEAGHGDALKAQGYERVASFLANGVGVRLLSLWLLRPAKSELFPDFPAPASSKRALVRAKPHLFPGCCGAQLLTNLSVSGDCPAVSDMRSPNLSVAEVPARNVGIIKALVADNGMTPVLRWRTGRADRVLLVGHTMPTRRPYLSFFKEQQ